MTISKNAHNKHGTRKTYQGAATTITIDAIVTTTHIILAAIIRQLDEILRAAHASRNCGDLIRTLVGDGPRERL